MGATTIDRASWTDKYGRRATVAQSDYENGIKKPRRDPVDAAIAAKETMVARHNEAMASGAWEDGLRFSGTEGWREASLKKGAPRFSTGVQFGLPKVRAFAEAFAPHLEQGLASVDAMPKRNVEEAIQKSAAMIRHNATFRFKKR